MKSKTKHSKALGSSFDSWLNEQNEGIRADIIAGAMKRHFVLELRRLMKVRNVGVNALQRALGTGPSQIQRLLDPEDVGVSLKSIAKLLAVLGASGHISVESKTSRKKAA